MADVLDVSTEEVQGYARDFERGVLVHLTGWTLETIDGMGAQDAAMMIAVLGKIREEAGRKK